MKSLTLVTLAAVLALVACTTVASEAPRIILPRNPILVPPGSPPSSPATASAIRSGMLKSLTVRTVHPMLVLPEGAWLYWQSGQEFKLDTDREVLPEAKDQRMWFNWDVSKIPHAAGVIWQVSRVTYRSRPTDPMEMKPHGLVLQGTADGASGTFMIDFKSLADEEGLSPVLPRAERPEVEATKPVAAAEPKPTAKEATKGLILSLLPKLKLGPQPAPPSKPAPDAGPARLAPMESQARVAKLVEFYKVSGGVPFYVRVIPVVSSKAETPVGRPSNTITTYYGRLPPGPPLVLKEPPPPKPAEKLIQVDQFVYYPHVTYCRAHSDKSYCGQFKGGNKDFFEDVGDCFMDAWNWTANTYQEAKKAVVHVVAMALPMVPESVLDTALDSALVAAGIPPDIPNLDDVMNEGADYLAGEVANQIGAPAAGDLARQKIREALLAGAKKAAAAKFGNAGPDTPCDYVTDPAYVVMTLRNVSPENLRGMQLILMNGNWNGVFDTVIQTIDLPRGATKIVVLGLPHSMRSEFCDGQLYSEGKWWDKYASVKSNFNLAGHVMLGKNLWYNGIYATPALDLTKSYQGKGK